MVGKQFELFAKQKRDSLVVHNFKGKTALVTGADGFIGSHLTEALVSAGANVTALSQYNSFGTNGWLDEISDDVRGHLDIRRGDIRDPFFVNSLAKGQQIIFHLAALIAIPYSYVAPKVYVDVNLTGTMNMMEAAKRSGVEKFVQTSTSEVYGTAQFTPITEDHPLQGQSPYAASKIAADMMAEAYARSYEMPICIVRPFNTYGPRQSERAVIPTVIRQALDPQCDSILLGNLSPRRDFNYVSDTVSGFLHAVCAPKLVDGGFYNVGSGVAVSISEMVEEVQNICRVNKPVQHEMIRERPKESEVLELVASAKKFNDQTDWVPQTDFKEGLKKTIDWWQERMRASSFRIDVDYLT